MEHRRYADLFLSIWLLWFSTVSHITFASDTIYAGQSLFSNQTLISKEGNFQLGFFAPGISENFYVGIWYNKVSVVNKTYVWVANRNTPLTRPTSSELKLLEDGNLVLYDQLRNVVWSTNTTSNAMNSSRAMLGDNGYLVLTNGVRASDVYWQSFDYPTDTILPGGRLGYDKRSKKSKRLTSWKNPNDPGEGIYSIEIDPVREQYVLKWNSTKQYWTSGPWDGQIFSGVPEMRSNNLDNFSYVNNVNESYFTYDVYNSSITSRIVMNPSGELMQLSWVPTSKQWIPFWSQPRQQCEVYAFCGAYGVCNQTAFPFCTCTKGFEPTSQTDWYGASFYVGCARACEGTGNFSLMTNVSFPVNPIDLVVNSAYKCRLDCLKDCSCRAYSYSRRGCLLWDGDLLYGDESGGDLYIRSTLNSGDTNKGISSTSGGSKKKPTTGAVAGAVAAALILVLIVSFFGLRKRLITKGSIKKTENEELELPLYELLTIERATNNFSHSSKIGQGGFGPVYKGVLQTGEEIAIKKLSKDSRQGLQEFMNEVVLIAKLQHRNLVRLLGCCIHGDERMLIYEYMSNKSLDLALFDKTRSDILNWKKRFDIIIGIARGLLYLHRDSRLRIIHRDLKAANVLLDCEMNPKISDFGMARTFRGDQTQENTMRVAGTYGYMSPEYATDGIFSMKSDVFSFGVLVLEIVCGNRNRGFRHADHELNLLGHAWKLLNDNKALELLDPSIQGSFKGSEVLKCIQVGLLCVQKLPKDRPAMSAVLAMLESDGSMLPHPKQPGFYTERCTLEVESSPAQEIIFTENDNTVTLLEGR